MKLPTTYITNQLGCFFVVEGSVNTQALAHCAVHKSLSSMYEWVCDTFAFSRSEVEGQEFTLSLQAPQLWQISSEQHGAFRFKTAPNNSIESWISNFDIDSEVAWA